MREIVFWGASGQARVLREALSTQPWRIVALIDRNPVPSPWPDSDTTLLVGAEAALDAWLARRPEGSAGLHGVAAIGRNDGSRLQVMDVLRQRGIELPSIVHPRAFVAADAQLGEGCQILAQAAVCSHATLGRGVIVNTAASVDHDCILEDGVHIAPGARLTGEVRVGTNAFIGAGAIVLPRLHVGRDAVVGAGSVVTHSVPDGAVVVGAPARPLSRQP